MIKPRIPANEAQRLAALEAYSILDRPAEAALKTLTKIAAAICETPIALISLVDRERQWFLSSVGLDAVQTSREISFCGHAINGDGIFVIPDALRDDRFFDNPLVVGEPGIRFYAGAPLRTADKLPIGALCVIDRKPRCLEPKQCEILTVLSDVVIHLLDQRKAEIEVNSRLMKANRLLELGERLAHTGSFQIDSATQATKWSAGLKGICGLNERDNLPSLAEMTDMFHPDDRERIIELREQTTKTGESSYAEARLFRRDGALRVLQMWTDAWRPADGALGIVGVVQDITERKTAEREAESSRNRLSALFDLILDGILISDPATGRYMEVNEAACRMFGFTRSELLERNIGDLSSGVHPYTLESALAHCREWPEGKSAIVEWHNKTKDGALFWSEISIKYARFGDAPAVLALVHDISVRKAIEQELVSLKERAERANQAKSAFLATMSHEIRTPMNGVLGMNALLLETDLTPQQRKMTETVRDSAEALLHLLDDILDFAKLEAGQVTLDESVFDLQTLVEKVVELFRPGALQKGLQLTATVDAGARGAFQGASHRLRQILLNLVANAVKFTERGGVTVTISATPCDENRARIRCEVYDTGIGVSAKAAPRLFAPFEQADASISQRFGGSGLGLSIARKLVQLMGGEIGTRDRPGGGSVFWFEIALRRAEPNECDARSTPTVGRIGAAAREAGRILLADDDAVNIEIATLTLKAAGYQVEVARDGAEAIAAARQSDFDLILMDVRMPVVDGLAATRAIRALPGPRGFTPILALTADAREDKRQACFDAGMDDFVTKPFVPSRLRDAVAQWIDKAPRKGPSKPPSADDTPLIDRAVIEELRSVMTANQFAGLVEMFVARAEQQAEAFPRWLAASATGEIAGEAHKLVSAAGALGARRVQKIAGRLENACREGGGASVPGMIEKLVRALTEASAELRRERVRAEVQASDKEVVAVG